MARHIAGKLKQSNKKHKGGIASNRAMKRMAGAGKVAGRSDGDPKQHPQEKAMSALTAKQIEQLR